jgi:hypothetical protein
MINFIIVKRVLTTNKSKSKLLEKKLKLKLEASQVLNDKITITS